MAGDAGFLFTVQELATAVETQAADRHPPLEQRCVGQIAGDMIHKGIPEIG